MLITKQPALQVNWSFPKSPGPDEVFGLAILSKVFPLFSYFGNTFEGISDKPPNPFGCKLRI